MALILNFSAYLASMTKVYVNMGFLVAAGILAALAADYFVTPVLLHRTRPFGEEGEEDCRIACGPDDGELAVSRGQVLSKDIATLSQGKISN